MIYKKPVSEIYEFHLLALLFKINIFRVINSYRKRIELEKPQRNYNSVSLLASSIRVFTLFNNESIFYVVYYLRELIQFFHRVHYVFIKIIFLR